MRSYFDTKKHEMFPEIKDWTDPQNRWRHDDNVRDMPYKYWFFFHPTAYHLIHYSIYVLSILIFTTVALLLRHNKFFLGLFSILVVYLTFNFVKKLRKHSIVKDANMFDILMREYTVDQQLKKFEEENKK